MDGRRIFSNFALIVLGILLILISIFFWFNKSITYYFWTSIVLGVLALILGLLLLVIPSKTVENPIPGRIVEKTVFNESTPDTEKKTRYREIDLTKCYVPQKENVLELSCNTATNLMRCET